MLRDVKLEWGNPKHIEMVRTYDEIMRGEKPVVLRTCIDYCIPVCKPDIHGIWYFERTGGRVTHSQHCVALCPQCSNDVELVWSKKFIDDNWHFCTKCDIEFELREERQKDWHSNEFKVYLKQEEVV